MDIKHLSETITNDEFVELIARKTVIDAIESMEYGDFAINKANVTETASSIFYECMNGDTEVAEQIRKVVPDILKKYRNKAASLKRITARQAEALKNATTKQIQIGSIVSFSGTFGMRRYTTRSGKVINIEGEHDIIYTVDTDQGKHKKRAHELTVRQY